MRIKIYTAKLLVILFLASNPIIFVNAQTESLIANVNINANCNGYWEYKPSGYNPVGSTTYPLIIFLPGIQQYGTGTSTDLNKLYDLYDGPPYWVHNGTNLSTWTVGGTTYNYIMVAPQWIRLIDSWDKYPTVDEINSFINYTIEHYKVDKSRVYLMGISTGAGSVWHYVHEGSAYANRIAAIVPFSGTDTPTHARAKVLYDRQMPIWGFHNSADAGVPVRYTKDWKDSINYWIPLASPFSMTPDPRITIFNTTGDPGNHVSWASGTQGTYTENFGGTNLNVYQWLLQYSHTPPANQPPVANAGTYKSIVSPNNSVQLQGSATDFDSYTLSYAWSLVSKPSGSSNPTISNATSLTPSISGLVEGTYVFKLTATDLTSLSGSSNIQVTVMPAGSLTKIEAENYSAHSGGTITSNSSTSGGSYVGNFSPGNWLDFPVNTNGGTFNFNFRVSSFFGGSFIVSSGASSATVNVTGSSDNSWRTVGISNFNLPAGAQTLRLTINAGSFGPDIDYLAFQSAALGPLPVKFVYFNSQCKGSSVALQWKTAQEQDTKDFSIQRSTDGVSWSEIGSVTAAGQSSQERSYVFVDRTLGSSSLYRIVENDNNGHFTMSNIVKSSCSSARNEISLYPNPSSGNSALNITLEKSTKVTIRIVDSKGAIMQQSQLQLPSGNTTLPLNLGNYAEGVYTIDVRYDNEMKSIKLIKK
jgi:poly(3-hydroxybutyrate) depolymerase